MSSLQSDFIFTEILPRLPAKSLMRFKCVSKSFNSVISSPDFLQQHLCYHTLSSPDLLILPENHSVTCYDLDFNTATASFHWPDSVNVKVVGSSNGLLCLYIYNNVTNYLCVLNPTTRICQDIHIPVTIGGKDFGFAFNPDNLDFKIVEVSYKESSERSVTRVYSLNTKSWTVIQPNLPGVAIIRRGDVSGCGAVINNHLLHWAFWIRKLKIECFDVCKNEWVGDVLLPRFYYDTTNINICLTRIGVLYGYLFASFKDRHNRCYDVWVMKEYGVQDSWFKWVSIPISNDLRDVVPFACRGGFTESTQVLIRQHYSAKLLWYNRNNGEISEAKFVGVPRVLGYQACMCSRSLVTLPDGKLFVNS